MRYGLLFILFTGCLSLRAQDSLKTQLVKQNLLAGDQFRKANDVQMALQNYFDALRLAEENDDTWLTARSTKKIGDLYNLYYRYAEAIPYYKSAYKILKETDSLAIWASVTNSIAWNHIKLGHLDSALVYSEESVRTYKKLQPRHTFEYCIALESLGEIYSLKNRFVDAKQVLDLCMQLATESNLEIARGFTHYGLAFNEYNQKNYPKARYHILQCLPVAEKYATQQLLADVYRLSYEIHNVLSFDGVAFQQLQRYAFLKDKIHSEDIEKKAAIINANFEIQKNKDDLKILSQLNSIQGLEIQRQGLIRNFALFGLVGFILIGILFYSRIRAKRKFEKQELQHKIDELEQARKVQLSLLPQRPIDNEVVEVRGKMITATEVGGDYYDYFQIDEHRLLVAFGDATGHGMTAGMMVTIAKVALLNNLDQLKDSNDLVSVIKAVNDSILGSVSVKGIGLALQLFLMDSKLKTLTFTSCGMPFPMIYDVAEHRLSTHEMRQPPLGFFKQMKISQKEIPFVTGQMLIVLSDGIFERFNLKKEEYGFERFSNTAEVQLRVSMDFDLFLNRIFEDADDFSEDTPNHDDMTALCARLK
ncbi:MAG: SpoIIE family protein phosphatase [Cyclobacteriaceae bacterium]